MYQYMFIGVCHTSYFTISKMMEIFSFEKDHGLDYKVFIMDNIIHYNYMAQGRSIKTAMSIMRKADKRLISKVQIALVNIGESTERIIYLSELLAQPLYRFYADQLKNYYDNNLHFQECVKLIITEIYGYFNPLFLNFMLAELPLWFHADCILQQQHITLWYTKLSPNWHQLLSLYPNANIDIILQEF